MTTLYDVNANKLIEQVAEELKKIDAIKQPAWTLFAKTGTHKDRPPVKADWWFVRVAAILRSVDKLRVVGVSKLRKKYGGRKRRGYKPPRFVLGSGSIIRKALQQLEKAEFLKKDLKSKHKGRVITPKGKSFLAKIAIKIYKEEQKNIPKPKVEVQKPEIKEKKKEKQPQEEIKPTEAPKKEPKPEKAVEVKKEVKAEPKPAEAPKEEKLLDVKKEIKEKPQPKEEVKKEQPKEPKQEEKKE